MIRHEDSKIRADILAAYIFRPSSALWHQSSSKQTSIPKTKDVHGNTHSVTVFKGKRNANILDLEVEILLFTGRTEIFWECGVIQSYLS